jgi:hypothetical protein
MEKKLRLGMRMRTSRWRAVLGLYDGTARRTTFKGVE